MAKQRLETIKNWFKTSLKPTQQQFWDTWDSFWHKDDKIPTSSIENLDVRFDEKADAELVSAHLNDSTAHGINNKVEKEAGKGLSSNDYTTAEKEKLSGIQEAATANEEDDYLLDRTNHTGVQEISTVNGLQGALDAKASLVDGKVPTSQLPAYVDDVLEYADLAGFPTIGENGKIYIAQDTSITYRWGGTAYVAIGSDLALGETSSTAYRGDYGKTAYDHSQLTGGNPHQVSKADIGLGNVDNTSDSGKPTSDATLLLLADKADLVEGKVPASQLPDISLKIKDKLVIVHGLVTSVGKTIDFPNTVTEIGDQAFLNYKLISVNIPNSVTHIGVGAFQDNQLTSVIIPNSVTSINDDTFQNNQLSSVSIPNSVTSIGDSALANNQLTSIIIPSSVTSIGDYAFIKNQISSASLPNSITSIGIAAFARNKLTSVTISNSITTINSGAFYENQLTSITIPNSVISIDDQAFAGNQLTSITIPNSVTTLGNSAFTGNQISSLTIPDSITNIGDFAFGGNKLTSITIPNSVTKIGSGAFANNQLTSITIPNSITSIGYMTFANNQLTSVTISSSVISIGNDAFSRNQLTAVVIPDSVTSIGGSAFANNKVTSVTIPNSVKSIFDYAFGNNNDLVSVSLPRGISLGYNVFPSTTEITYYD